MGVLLMALDSNLYNNLNRKLLAMSHSPRIGCMSGVATVRLEDHNGSPQAKMDPHAPCWSHEC